MDTRTPIRPLPPTRWWHRSSQSWTLPDSSSSSPVRDPDRSSPTPHCQRPPAWRVATSLTRSFYYAGMGLAYAYNTQRNFRIHLGVAILALGLAWGFHLRGIETALIVITCGLVLALELLNTALEAVVDLTVGQEYHILAKIAKDCAAAAVLVGAGVALIIAALLLLPPIWQWIQTLTGLSGLTI